MQITFQEETWDEEAKAVKQRKTDSGESRDGLVYRETSQTVFCSVCHQHASDNDKRTSSFSARA